MDARSLTYRGLAESTRKLDGKGITHAHINMLANGHDKPSMRAMELIAAAPSTTSSHGVASGSRGDKATRKATAQTSQAIWTPRRVTSG